MSYLHPQAEWKGPSFFLSHELHPHLLFHPACLFSLSALPFQYNMLGPELYSSFRSSSWMKSKNSDLVSVDENDCDDDDFFTFSFSSPSPPPFPPSLHLQSSPLPPPPIPNHSKKEKAWGRAHLPQMSDECVATRDPHSSPPPPPSVLTVYRHPQSLADDVPSRRFRFRYLKFGVILWTFFYFTDVCVLFVMSGIEGFFFFLKIDGSEAFGAKIGYAAFVVCCHPLDIWYLLEECADAGPPNGHAKLFGWLSSEMNGSTLFML